MSALPGSATAIRTCAAMVTAAAAEAEEAGRSASAGRRLLAWTGEASDLCRSRIDVGVDSTDALAPSLRRVARALGGYADVLADCQARAVGFDADVSGARKRMGDSLIDWDAWRDYLAARLARHRVGAEAEEAAANAAQEIRAAVGTGDDAAQALDDERLRGAVVPDDVLATTSWDQASVTQNQIGDCYLLASIMGIMRTGEGDDLLRRNVCWDATQGGYLVTLYPDGKPVQVFVDAAYLGGARQDGQVGIATIYEAAVGIQLGFPDFNDGGWPKDALQLVTGGEAREYETGSSWWNPFDDRFGETQTTIADDLSKGAAVIADTSGRPSAENLPVTVIEPTGEQVERSLTISSSHAYMVERIEDDGSVWVRNPWGLGNPFDGGALIKLTPEQFANVFRAVTVSDVP